MYDVSHLINVHLLDAFSYANAVAVSMTDVGIFNVSGVCTNLVTYLFYTPFSSAVHQHIICQFDSDYRFVCFILKKRTATTRQLRTKKKWYAILHRY